MFGLQQLRSDYTDFDWLRYWLITVILVMMGVRARATVPNITHFSSPLEGSCTPSPSHSPSSVRVFIHPYCSVPFVPHDCQFDINSHVYVSINSNAICFSSSVVQN